MISYDAACRQSEQLMKDYPGHQMLAHMINNIMKGAKPPKKKGPSVIGRNYAHKGTKKEYPSGYNTASRLA
jgi:hypothetical protein